MCCYLCASENANVEVKTPRGDIAYICESCDGKFEDSEKKDQN